MIPPKSFLKLTQEEQVTESERRMNAHYDLYERWKHIARDARKKRIVEADDDRPDELILKAE
jgi:hypothetical protein